MKHGQQGKTSWRQERAKNKLYKLLDERYNLTTFGNIWKKLEALDHGLVAGSLKCEPFDSRVLTDSNERLLAEELFTRGQNTVLFRMKTHQEAEEAANFLTELLTGSNIRNQVTACSDGTYQVRTNLDKQLWDKLTVLCQYRFNREIDPKDQHGHLVCAQKHINVYLEQSDQKHWNALPGVPAFITLMGLPGVLRPHAHVKPDAKRKQQEFDSHGPLGEPWFLRGIPIHVELKSGNGGLEVYS